MRLAILAVVAACESAKPSAPDPAPVVVPPKPAATPVKPVPPPTAKTRTLADYPAAIEPAKIACTLDGVWHPDQPRELRFRADGPVFGTLHHVTKAHLALTDTAAFADFEGKIRMWGYVARDKLFVHASRPFLAGYLIPGPQTTLRIDAVRATGITVVPHKPHSVRQITPVSAERECGDLALTVADFLGRDAIDRDTIETKMLPDQVAIPMSIDAGGKPALELKFPKGGDPMVDVVDQQGDQARIVVSPPTLDPEDSALIVGWVKAAILRPHTHGFGGSWTTGGEGGMVNGPPRAKRTVTCTHEVPLVVELAGEQHLVGAVPAKTPIGVIGDKDALVEIEVRNASFAPAAGAKLLAKLAALADCK